MTTFKDHILQSLCEKINVNYAKKKIDVDISDTFGALKDNMKIIKENFLEQAVIIIKVAERIGFEGIKGELNAEADMMTLELVSHGEYGFERENIVELIRRFGVDKSGSVMIELESLHLNRKLQKFGLAKLLHFKLSQLAKKLKVKRYEVDAANVGKYAWLRYGFKPTDMKYMLNNLDPDNAIVRKIRGQKTPEKQYKMMMDYLPRLKKMIIGGEIGWAGTLDISSKKKMDEFRKHLRRTKNQRKEYKYNKSLADYGDV